MPIYTKHPEYKAASTRWAEYRVTTSGGRAIKHPKVSQIYLPKLADETNVEYKARRGRALFYPATKRTVEGLVGAIFRKDPIQLPEKKANNEKDQRNRITKDGRSELELLYYLVLEVTRMGRVGLLTDFPQNDEEDPHVLPYISTYTAESIINWDSEMFEGRETLNWVVLQESYTETVTDKFVKKIRIQFRELSMDNGICVQRVWRPVDGTHDGFTEDNWIVYETIIPKVKGKPIKEIPFDIINPYNSEMEVYDSPIDGVSEVNISHYNNSADLEHGLHFTGLPTAILAGFPAYGNEGDALQYRVGSTTALVSKDADAKGSYMEVKGNFKGLADAMKSKEAMMAILGARILDDTKNAVEAAETHKLRRVGENSILASTSKSVSKTYSAHAKRRAKWGGMPGWENYSATLNTDFNAEKLSAQELTAYVLAWQNMAITDDTLVYNIKQGEMLRPGRTIEQEIAEINARKEKEEARLPLTAAEKSGQDPTKTLGKLDDPDDIGNEDKRKLKADSSNANENVNALKKSTKDS